VSLKCSESVVLSLLCHVRLAMKFTKAEYADMHFMYGICDGNSLAAFS
jgi:hypothetical protein